MSPVAVLPENAPVRAHGRRHGGADLVDVDALPLLRHRYRAERRRECVLWPNTLVVANN
jgi:hypothetical protein